jgi:hypothetical protein
LNQAPQRDFATHDDNTTVAAGQQAGVAD